MPDTLLFARSLYSDAAVADAAKAFEHLAKIEVTDQGEHIELVVSEPDPDVADVIMDELGNFALALTVRARQ